jgi:dihydrofolate reductase
MARCTVGRMSRVVYFTACTLDGFIADERNSLDWLFETPHGDDESAWDEFIGAVGPMCMGRTTYEWMLNHHPDLLTGPEQWQAFYGDRPAWVFTHRTDLPSVVGAEIRFVQGDVRPVYDDAGTSRRRCVDHRRRRPRGDSSTTPASSTA